MFQKAMKYWTAAATALMLSAAGASVAADTGKAAEPVRGGTLYAAINPEPVALTATYNNQYANRAISSNIFDGLAYYDDKYEPQPRLAESWEVSPDGLSITFHLRKGVKWHDGQPFTSADVKYSALEVWKKFHSRGRSTFANLRDVETPDEYTAIFKLDSPSQVVLNALDVAESQVLPKHIFDDGTDFRKHPGHAKPIGTGPFRVVRWQRGQYVELERNPDYWDSGKPYLDKVVWRFIPDDAGRGAALESGEVQYIPFAGVPFSDLDRLKQNGEVVIDDRGYSYAAQTYFFAFNQRSPILANPKVREAIAYAIDRQRLIDLVWYGYSKPEHSIVPEALVRFYTPDVPRFDYDLAKAAKLLDEAGYPAGKDGTRFTLRLYTDPSSERFPFAGEFFRQEFGKLGIKIDFSFMDNATFLSRVYSDYDFDVLFQGWGVMLDPQMGLTRVLWSKAQSPGVPYANAFKYEDAETDKLIEAYQTTADPAERVKVFHDLQRHVGEQLPLIPVMAAPFFTAHSKRLHGLDVSPTGAHAAFREVWLEPR